MLQDIITTILTSGTVTGIFLAIIKRGIDYRFEKELATYKEKIKLESAAEIEKLKSQLEITATERSIKLTKIFEKQADVIAITYQMFLGLLDASNDFAEWLRNNRPNKGTFFERLKLFNSLEKAIKTIQSYLPQNEIYLPKSTSRKIYQLAICVGCEMAQYDLTEEAIKDASTGKIDKKIVDEQMKRLTLCNNDTAIVIGELKEDFQKILGITAKDNEQSEE